MRNAVIGVVVLSLLFAGCMGTSGTSDPGLGFETATNGSISYEGRQSPTMNSGAGVYVTDYDTDGWPDVLLLGGAPRGTDGQRPALYHNTGGEFDRADILPRAAYEDRTVSGALFFDYDNDGDDDLLLLALKDDPVFLENREGDFVIRDVGLNRQFEVPLGATAADYDGDGRLDLVIYQNGNWQNETPAGYRKAGPVTDDNGNPNVLYRWNGTGFERVPGAFEGTRWTLGVSFVDLTGDGRPDVHFTNDYNNDVVYVNEGGGEFRGTVPGAATNRNGMASEVFDANGDGRPDIFVTNIYFNSSKVTGDYTTNYLRNVLGKRAKGNNLLINGPDAAFADKAAEYGVVKGGWGWAAVAADLDNDGDTDIVHATQEFTDTFLRKTFKTSEIPSFYSYPAAFDRTAGEFRQRDAAGLGFSEMNTRGMARLDYDRDGDIDLLFTQWSQGKYVLYENTGANANWIELSLRGSEAQTTIGATVTVTAGNETWTRYLNSRADYQSQDSRTVHVGLGDHGTIDRIEITWPNGETTVLRDVKPNARLVVGIDGSVKRVE